MTEKEERNYEKLCTLEDYIYVYGKLDEVLNGYIDTKTEKDLVKARRVFAKGIKEKSYYLSGFSKDKRRKQSIFSKLRDRKIEKQQALLEKQQAKEEYLLKYSSQNAVRQNLLTEPAPKSTFWTRLKAVFCKPKELALPAPQPPATPPQNEDTETEVVDKAENEDTEDEVLDF